MVSRWPRKIPASRSPPSCASARPERPAAGAPHRRRRRAISRSSARTAQDILAFGFNLGEHAGEAGAIIAGEFRHAMEIIGAPRHELVPFLGERAHMLYWRNVIVEAD